MKKRIEDCLVAIIFYVSILPFGFTATVLATSIFQGRTPLGYAILTVLLVLPFLYLFTADGLWKLKPWARKTAVVISALSVALSVIAFADWLLMFYVWKTLRNLFSLYSYGTVLWLGVPFAWALLHLRRPETIKRFESEKC